MPAQKQKTKRGVDEDEEYYFEEDQLLLAHRRSKKKICCDDDDEPQPQQHEHYYEEEDDADKASSSSAESSPCSSSSSLLPDHDHDPEYIVFVQLPDIHKDVQCPICLGIIKKTRTVMECLHRFCRECIDKSMRMGNNECPACRTHCASRRSLRDDPNYDALIALLYPDISKYEQEELAFHEEDHTRNKQIQASIAQILQRQSEALVKRRTPGKDTQDTYMTRTQRNSYLRRRSSRAADLQGSEDNEDGHENNITGTRDDSSNDERRPEVRPRRRRRRGVANNRSSSQPAAAAANSDWGTEIDLEGSRGISPGLAWNSEILAWGRGGARSHTRHGNSGGWSSRNTRLSKLVDYLRNLDEKYDEELDVHVVLISLDNHSVPRLPQPHLCCRPSLSVKGLCEYVAGQTPLKVEEVELLALSKDDKMGISCSKSTTDLVSVAISASKDEIQVVGAEETLATVRANFTFTSSRDTMILLYRRKGGS